MGLGLFWRGRGGIVINKVGMWIWVSIFIL